MTGRRTFASAEEREWYELDLLQDHSDRLDVDEATIAGHETRIVVLETGAAADSEHNGTGADSTQVGTGAIASGAATSAFGDFANAAQDGGTAVGMEATAGFRGIAIGEASGDGDIDSANTVIIGWGVSLPRAVDSVGIGSPTIEGAGAGPHRALLFGGSLTGSGSSDVIVAGQGSSANGDFIVAVGTSTQVGGVPGVDSPASDVVAFGHICTVGPGADDAIAVGHSTFAEGIESIAVGHGAHAGGLDPLGNDTQGTAVGAGTDVNAYQGSAFGAVASVGTGHDQSTAVGANAATTAANQVMLGTATEDVQAPGDAHLAGTGKTLGLLGAAGTTKQTITGARDGNAALASLLTALAGHGLLTDSTTAGTAPTGHPSVVTKTTTYTAADNELVLASASGGAWALTLPAPSNGAMVTVKKTDATANAVTVTPPSGTIDGAANFPVVTQYQSATFVSDATNWFVT